jgi:5-methylcytosine-specific restriction protein A
MPMGAYRPCVIPGCITLVRSGSLCDAHRHRREVERGTSTARGYGYAWRKIRDAFLQKRPWCSDVFGFHEGALVPAVHVDHRIPKSRGGTDDESNLDGKCGRCHNHKTATSDGGFGNQQSNGRGGRNV